MKTRDYDGLLASLAADWRRRSPRSRTPASGPEDIQAMAEACRRTESRLKLFL